MKIKWLLSVVLTMTMGAVARSSAPFVSWKQLEEGSPYIIIARCGNPVPASGTIVYEPTSDSTIDVIFVLKGTNSVSSARLWTDHWLQPGENYPVSTNLMLSVDWGSAVKNSGDGYLMTPNGKFAQFQLADATGNIIPPNPHAGANLLERHINGDAPRFILGLILVYETNLPAWVSPASGSLVADFPRTISINVYPQFKYGGIVGEIGSATNLPPFNVGLLKLDEIYSIANEGDYTLTVQPVLYKRYNHPDNTILDRVDLPVVTTKIHMMPNVKQ
jgi:hypothetical protein